MSDLPMPPVCDAPPVTAAPQSQTVQLCVDLDDHQRCHRPQSPRGPLQFLEMVELSSVNSWCTLVNQEVRGATSATSNQHGGSRFRGGNATENRGPPAAGRTVGPSFSIRSRRFTDTAQPSLKQNLAGIQDDDESYAFRHPFKSLLYHRPGREVSFNQVWEDFLDVRGDLDVRVALPTSKRIPNLTYVKALNRAILRHNTAAFRIQGGVGVGENREIGMVGRQETEASSQETEAGSHEGGLQEKGWRWRDKLKIGKNSLRIFKTPTASIV